MKHLLVTALVIALCLSAVFAQSFTSLTSAKTEFSVEPNSNKLFKLDESKNPANLIRFSAQGCNYGAVTLYIKICNTTATTCVDSHNVPSSSSYDILSIVGSGESFNLCSNNKNVGNLCSAKNIYYIQAVYSQDLIYDNTVTRYFSLGYTVYASQTDAPKVIDRASFNLTMNSYTEFAWTTPKVCLQWDTQGCVQLVPLTNVQYQLYYVEQSIFQFFSLGLSGLSWNIESECGSKRAGVQKLGSVLTNVNKVDTSDLTWFGYMTMSVSGTDPDGKIATANNLGLYPYVRIDLGQIIRYVTYAAVAIVACLCCCCLLGIICCVVSCALALRPKQKQYYTNI